MPTDRAHHSTARRWNLGTAGAIGVAFLIIGIARDQLALGISGLVIMAAYGGVLELMRHRSEAAHLLAPGGTNDGRQQRIGIQALATTGGVLVVFLVIGAFWTYGTDGPTASVFQGLCALGGATFILATVVFSRRG